MSSRGHVDFGRLFATKPVMLAPMEDVTDRVFRRVCRERGADVAFTEFVHAGGLAGGLEACVEKARLDPDEITAIQIYGSDPQHLVEAARRAEALSPAFLDLNCGCWVPKVARSGAGAAWLEEPAKMVEMAAAIVRAVALPVTVKTRIGLGGEATMPIVDLARRLEDVGVRALTIHCRVAKKGHDGPPDWSWARRARAATRLPIVVNGGIESAEDAVRALDETGAAAVMVGRRAIAHPWVFREIRSRLDGHGVRARPTQSERVTTAREHLLAWCEAEGPRLAVRGMRRFYAGYFTGVPDATTALRRLPTVTDVATVLDILAALDE